ncbi:zinc-dependent microcin-processing U62/PmbA/TldD [Acetobacter nitrogenifigens DSM 23921 = NBRC 105050]|uniref:Modulator protein n=1 Tax=Acetobacter nitrogenifigens DSM 23921 = NBRC 105050 TaxID=1120919 RepID=A0A511X5Y9_9PROT|nr:TldD/PmbA family protein [Acetobacter nitrogenifigens]GBQ98675.1 zinc-dependent microcin-processing U62/PmbA/TldD [Acetobacter nitrogenifigens DSM 23921 = NBRC 105050]GEN58354.1 modulator protein [Acetobacter nitrogenifigens DSM 23921 = NBRC 105050]
MTNAPLDLACDLVARAKKGGADAADAVFIGGTSLGVGVRYGATEELERSETTDLGLRVFLGRRAAIVSTSNLDPAGFEALIEQALAMARVLPEDAHAGLPDSAALIGRIDQNDLDLVDPTEPAVDALLDRARAVEDAARAIGGVTNTSGASASWGRSEVALASTLGVAGHYARTSHSMSISVLAGEGTDMQRDYDYDSAVHLSDLGDPTAVGTSAGRKAVARLNPSRPRTGAFPVVFDPRISNSFLGHLSGAINGASIARGTSFLKTKLGERIFADGVSVIDDPTRRRGARSRPFDGEGLRCETLSLVEDGVLQTWVLDSRSGRQLGLRSNGRATRGASSPPSPGLTNLFFTPGQETPEALMSDIQEGLYITEMMGSAINGITGDYSRGGAGFMIRNGQLAEPIAEFTIAGNLLDMFARIRLANDLRFRFGSDAPTLRIDALSVAGA